MLEVLQVGGVTFSDREIYPVRVSYPRPLRVGSLCGLCHVATSWGLTDKKILISAHDQVELISGDAPVPGQEIRTYAVATYLGASFPYDRLLPQDVFLSNFQQFFGFAEPTKGVYKDLKQICRGINTEKLLPKYTDDFLVLRTASTFSEVRQPHREFILRVEQGASGLFLGLFSTDYEAWKDAAKHSISQFFLEFNPEFAGYLLW